MAIIHIDGKVYDVEPGKNLLETCLSLGLDLPYFCWHHSLGSVGACRQCAVKVYKDEHDTKGHIVMSCMEIVKDNMFVSIEDPTAKAFRAQIIEWLMINHPHDCAVCDEGGACHLQDMTVMTGHNYRRFRFKKRTYLNQNLGPFINHEMNRCIQCYRCVRFYKDYAGGKDLDVFAAHDHVYFGRATEGILENEFSGNLAEICPTGVFTDKTLKQHYSRKWDMTMAPSICQHCGLGCNTIAAERYGMLKQITNRFNGEVNGYFICDRGRFGYKFVNSTNRVTHPLYIENITETVDEETLLNSLKDLLSNNSRLLGIGSPRASLESNFALMQLVGKENFYQGISENETQMMKIILDTLNSGHVHIPSLKETEQADSILILSEDLTNSAPMLALALRQAVQKVPREKAKELGIPSWHDSAMRENIQQNKSDLIIINITKTKLDEIASQKVFTSPDNIACLGFAVAHFLNKEAPLPNDIDQEMLELSKNIAAVLNKAKKPLIISGTSCYSPLILQAASNIAYALEKAEKKADLFFVVPECNSMGLAMMNAPSLLEATQALKTSKCDGVIILENDLYRRGNKIDIDQIFDPGNKVIVIDHLKNATSKQADVLIPTATFAEAEGTIVNNEGRAQCFLQVFKPKNENLKASWKWLSALGNIRTGNTITVSRDELLTDLIKDMPWFKGVDGIIPAISFRISGQKIPREPHRYSGRTAMLANINVNEPKPPEDKDSALSFTMEGYRGLPPAPLTPFYWSPGWNSVQSVNKYQNEVGGHLKGGDPGKRLFSEIPASEMVFFKSNESRKGNKPEIDDWILLPLPHIFGSEELSINTSGIAERTPKPYIAIGPADAEKLNVREGDSLIVRIKTEQFDLPVVIKEELVIGMACLPFIHEFTDIEWPLKGQLIKGNK